MGEKAHSIWVAISISLQTGRINRIRNSNACKKTQKAHRKNSTLKNGTYDTHSRKNIQASHTKYQKIAENEAKV